MSIHLDTVPALDGQTADA